MVTLFERGESHALSDGSRAVEAAVVGVLGLDDVATLKRSVAKLLVRTRVLIVDVSDMRIRQPSTVDVFSGAVLAAGGWPRVRLAVVEPDGRVAAALRKTGVAQEVHVVPTVEDALKKLEFAPNRVSSRHWLRLGGNAHRAARTIVARICREWQVEHLTRAAEIVADEITAVAVGAPGDRAVLKVSLDDAGLRISVRDFGPDRGPVTGRVAKRLERLCDSHGATPLSDGRVVWAVLADRQ